MIFMGFEVVTTDPLPPSKRPFAGAVKQLAPQPAYAPRNWYKNGPPDALILGGKVYVDAEVWTATLEGEK